jgi:PPOX class probable F420-dependent enzyme
VRILADLPRGQQSYVENRLRSNLMAWLTTVRPSGQPDQVPVWFLLRTDETIVVYSQPGKPKLRNIQQNPNVALGLDVTDVGRDVVRIEGTARVDPAVGPPDNSAEFIAKYVERIGALFDTPERFGQLFSAPIVIVPRRVRASSPSTRSLE